MYITEAKQMKAIDECAINGFGINSLILMEHAAAESVNIISKKFKQSKSCVVICGKGNNGGDGFAVARLLHLKGFNVTAAFFSDPQAFSADCLTNYKIAKKLEIDMICDMAELESVLKNSDFTIDALFGFGFHGSLDAFDLEIVKLINSHSSYIYSIDIPSGISADCGIVMSDAVKADETLTFTAYKKSSFLFPASDYYGKITVLDISVPQTAVKDFLGETIEKPFLPKRGRNINKSDAGKILVVAGSISMSGAAYMSAVSALKSGAGLVTLAVPECCAESVKKSAEIMTLAMPCEHGIFSADAAPLLCGIVNNYDAVVFGPGVARSDSISFILKEVLKVCKVPFIIDADGLFALKDCCDFLNNALCEIIITPHSMEMSRLVGKDVSYVEKNRFEVCREFSEKYAICTVLKGAFTIVCDKSGEIAVNNLTANPGMATAGSGDVLSGITAAFAAKYDDIFEAAKTAVYIHGLAGDFACEKFGEASMCAGDIINNISEAIKHETKM